MMNISFSIFFLLSFCMCVCMEKEFESLWPILDVVVDGGRIEKESEITARSGSTVVDLSLPGFYSIIREGW